MSQIGPKRRVERPQEGSEDGLSYDAEMAPVVQNPSSRKRVPSPQVGGDKEPSDNLGRICEEFKKILSEIEQQNEILELYLSGIQETVAVKVAEVVEEFVKCERRRLEEKKKAVLDIVSETNGALQRIAELEKMRDTIKEAMQATWNALA
ncbi:uncharacterized protein LOC125947401 [Dermacentor silvarum]|uniref:uncharacterized protein LOC125947401 n=1 Tax=Dermacentor silvarum TaxID=543639 RepID=UPI002100B04D|nr:uncharacterized protein LOC125947401 [Dermacentor silvarum]